MHVQQAYCSDLAAEPGKLDAASLPLNGVVVREHHPGRLLRAWQHNCVAIGEAACVFDPVHFVELHAVQLGLVHLLPLFPVQANCDVERDEYNQNVRAGYSRLRDFQAAHYHLNRYGEFAFWSRARAKAPNPVLAHKIRAFRARGEAVDYENEAFHPDDWRQLLIGHGVIPESWDPAADLTPAEVLENEMLRILGFIRRKVEEQPAHQDHLRARCTPGV